MSLPSSPQDLPAASPFKVRSPLLVVVFSIITVGLYTWYWAYQVGREMREFNGSGLGPGLNLVLAIFLNIVLLFTIPNDVRSTYEREGRTTDISAWTALWNLIPIAGTIVWFYKVQNRLNDLWVTRQP